MRSSPDGGAGSPALEKKLAAAGAPATLIIHAAPERSRCGCELRVRRRRSGRATRRARLGAQSASSAATATDEKILDAMRVVALAARFRASSRSMLIVLLVRSAVGRGPAAADAP